MPRFAPRRYSDSGGDPTEQENRLASKLGGKRVSGSGASMFSKADVRDIRSGDMEFLCEAKQTIHKSISIKWDWLKKISCEADDKQCFPLLSFEIQGGEDDPRAERDWIAMPVSVFNELKG